MTATDPHAEAARQCIEATLGVTAELWDAGGRQGACDVRYVTGSRVVVVEVKRVVDSAFRAASAAADSAGYTRDGRLRSVWHVYVDHGHRMKPVRSRAGELLAPLDAMRWNGAGRRFHELRIIAPEIHRELDRLGVRHVFALEPTEKHPPGFYVMPNMLSYWVPDVDDLPAIASRVLADDLAEKLRDQLARAEADERHAFLFFGAFENAAAGPLREPGDTLPSAAPTLPAPIDGLWITSDERGARVIAWLPHRGWVNAARWQEPTG